MCAVGVSAKARAALFAANNDGKDEAITAESCAPANGFIDPGETNTVSFVIKNTSGADQAHVKVSILELGGVTFPSGQVDVGAVAKDATFTVSFQFRASGSCGGVLTPTLHVVSDAGSSDISYIPFQLGATVKTTYAGSNTGAITINDYNTDSAKLGRATPYPSTITMSGIPKADTGETIDKVTVTLNNVTHGYSPDIQVLLVAPNGTRVALMGDAGGTQAGITAPINNVTLTFDESAAGKIPQGFGAITTGTYKTSDYNSPAYNFPDVGAANGSSLGAFNNMSDPNGAWKLYVVDASTGEQGVIAGGWNLNIRTTKIVCCGAGQLYPFVSRIDDTTVAEDLNGGENVQIATFTVSDLDDSDASKLTVTATSGDTTKVTDDNLVVGGSGVNRTLTVKHLVANASGDVTITVHVTDPQGHTSDSPFVLHIVPVNDAPTISQILGQKLTRGTPTGPLPFTVGDVETLPENLAVLVATSDATVVPVQNIVVSGTGANRTVNVLPFDSNTSGAATITLTVRDLGQPGDTSGPKSTPMSFVVNFGATPGNPTITPLSPASVKEDNSITIPFNVRSGSSASPDSLTLTPTSSDTTLLPLSGITFAGSGSDRTVTLTPAPNRNGTSTVTITVSNGSLTDTTSFLLTVTAVNDAPTITSVGPQVTNEDTTSGDIVFTVGDIETSLLPTGDLANLAVTASSDNTALIPNRVNQSDFATAGGYQITANGGTRTLKVRPAPNQFGKANVSVSVTDAGDPVGSGTGDGAPKTTTTTFVMTVNSVNDAPNIAAVGNDADHLVSWGANDPTISFDEDSGSSADATKGQRTIVLSGITPGPANESAQSVTVAASSDKPDVISIVKVDPATVTGASANTTLTVVLGANKYTAADNPVHITLTLTDNGGSDLGGVNNATKKFNIQVNPVNDAPVLSFPTLPAPLPGQDLSELNEPKNRSFTVPMNLTDVETPKTLMNMSVSVQGDTAHVFTDASGSANSNILFDVGRTQVTFLPNSIAGVTLPYTVTVTITATDNGATNNGDNPLSTSKTFKVTIRDIEPPTITSSSNDIQMDEDTPATATLTVSDNHPVSNLTFTVKSDNPTLIPSPDGILMGPLSNPTGLTSTRTLAIVPAPDQNGVANVTITAKDDEGLESSTTIKVTVRSVNDPPTIALRGIITPVVNSDGTSSPASITILEDKSTKDDSTASKLLEFNVADAPNETPADLLVITAASSNTDLVPVGNIVWSTSGNLRTLIVTPAPNKNGSTTITLTVTDQTGLSSSARFVLNVTPVNDAPTIDQVNNINLTESGSPATQTVNLTGITVGPDTGTSQANGPAQLPLHVTVNVKDRGSDPAVNTLIAGTWPTSDLAVSSDGKASFTFTPLPFAHGTATFTVTVRDSAGTDNDGKDTTTMSFDVVIAGVNQLPVISFDQSNLNSGSPTTSVSRTLDPGQNTGVISFYIDDVEQHAHPELLTVTAVSSNPTLVPNTSANLQLGGSFGTRGILIQPAPGQAGSAVITLTVTDLNGGSRTATVNLTVRPGIGPTVSLNPTTQTIHPGQFTDLILVTIGDAQTGPDSLTLTATTVSTSNANLLGAPGTAVPSGNLQFGGSGASRAMIILPNANQTGTAVVRITARDPDGNTGSADFTLVVVGEPPTITAVADQTVAVNKTSTPAPFTVSDKETFPGLLQVTGTSSDPSIIANNNIFVFGNQGARTVSVLAGNKAGTATITLTVKDTENQTATTSFNVTVTDNRHAPTITPKPAPDQTTLVNKAAGPINFTVGDVETAPANLVVTATSSNTNLVPNTTANLAVLTSSNPSTRSLLITPVADQTGVTLITVTVTDADNMTATTQFTLNVVRSAVAHDFNGDGSQDIIFQSADGFLAAWFMSGDDLLSSSFVTPNNVGNLGWKVVGDGDFNGDGKPDLLFQFSDGSLVVWIMDGVVETQAKLLVPSNTGNPQWKAVATGDFNNDGKVDILFKRDDGTLVIWYMDGVNILSAAMVNPSVLPPGWNVVGTGDFNGDGSLDIVFQHDDGTLVVWYMTNGNNLLLASTLQPSTTGDPNWRAVGTTDMNGDGKPDLLLQNRATQAVGIWYMDGPKLILGKVITPVPVGTWNVVAP